MKLWSGVLSGNSAKVRIALAEKGLDFEVLEVPWSRDKLWAPKSPEFLAVSPRGQVPVLVDGDLPIHDSTVINEYLEDRYPDTPLFPSDAVARAQCRKLEDDADHMVMDHLGILIRGVFLESPDMDVEINNSRQAYEQYMEQLDDLLTDQDYLCGSFSVADIAAFMAIAFAMNLGVTLSQKNLERWYERMLARPAVKADFAAILETAAKV